MRLRTLCVIISLCSCEDFEAEDIDEDDGRLVVNTQDFGIAKYSANDFIVVTEEGKLYGYDYCGRGIWSSSMGRSLVNATSVEGDSSTDGTRGKGVRMIPAVDGTLYMLSRDSGGQFQTMEHVNASIISVVAESPFVTPAFPNCFLTGSKLQSVETLSFDESFTGWFQDADFDSRKRFEGRSLIYSINDWIINAIHTTTHALKWSLSFADLPSFTSVHNDINSEWNKRANILSSEIGIVGQRTVRKEISNSVYDSCSSSPSVGADNRQNEIVELEFPTQVLGVYAVLDPPDTDGRLAMVLVAKSGPIPTQNAGFGLGAPDDVMLLSGTSIRGVSVQYPLGASPNMQMPYLARDPGGLISSESPYYQRLMDQWNQINSVGQRLLLPPMPSPMMNLSHVVKETTTVEFLSAKFNTMSRSEQILAVIWISISITALAVFSNSFWRRLKKAKQIVGAPNTIVGDTNGGASLGGDQSGGDRFFMDAAGTPLLTPRHGNSNNIEDITQPYEIIQVGQSDAVEFMHWQLANDVSNFDRRFREMSQRLTKIPFAHSVQIDGVNGEQLGNMTVMFLGRNVDDPKFVFRNPRSEKRQRPNVPQFTQSIRNAVAASALRETHGMKAYVPRSICGKWNSVQGIFQEFVGHKNKGAGQVTLQHFRESPQLAVDLALLVMLLRDTDAHDDNYLRDFRRKIALFDLGCALGDRPLPATPIEERACLMNFDLWRRLPYLLDCPFESRHLDYINSISWESLRDMWNNYNYPQYIVDAAANVNTRERLASSSNSPLATTPVIEPANAASSALESLLKQKSPLSSTSAASTNNCGNTQNDPVRLVSPCTMLRVMEINANFLKKCIEENRTMLFAAEVMYSGLYDDTWLDCINACTTGGCEDGCMKLFEERLLRIAAEADPTTLFPDLLLKCQRPDTDESPTMTDGVGGGGGFEKSPRVSTSRFETAPFANASAYNDGVENDGLSRSSPAISLSRYASEQSAISASGKQPIDYHSSGSSELSSPAHSAVHSTSRSSRVSSSPQRANRSPPRPRVMANERSTPQPVTLVSAPGI